MDFFRSYFQVYESMKINRNIYAKECSNISFEIDNLKNKLILSKSHEQILETGLTNNSKLFFEIIDFKPIENAYRTDTKIIICLDDLNEELELNLSNIKKIKEM